MFDETGVSNPMSDRRRPKGAKNLVIGLDGADVDVLIELGPDRLPNLYSLMGRGGWARQQSIQPPATLPNWTTFLTGVDPGEHGVFDFTTRHGYQVKFTAGSVREAPTIAARLDRLGKRCACLAFPATYPPERLENGVFMSGWDAPVAFQDDPSFVWPTALHAEIQARFGATQFDDVDEFSADQAGWHEALPGALVQRIERKRDLASWLLIGDGWDFFAVYFGESDTAAHHLWAHHDPSSPRHRPEYGVRDGLTRVYIALDEAVGELVEAAGPSAEITIVSDHGSGGASDRVLYLNRALEEAGLLRFRTDSTLERLRSAVVRASKDAALTLLPPSVRERIFRLGNARLPSMLESQARFGAIDMQHTQAFSDELNYFPAIWLNLAGREPQGIVTEGDAPQVVRTVQGALKALVDPWDGGLVVDTVWRREELFEGPFVDRAPDLLLKLRRVPGPSGRDYSYNVMPSGSAPPLTGPFRRLARDEYLGRKGRSLPGSHRDHGLFVAAGPSVAPVGEIEMTIADASATLLARMGIAVPPEAAGRVLFEILQDTAGRLTALPEMDVVRKNVEGSGQVAIEKRLRAMGYID